MCVVSPHILAYVCFTCILLKKGNVFEITCKYTLHECVRICGCLMERKVAYGWNSLKIAFKTSIDATVWHTFENLPMAEYWYDTKYHKIQSILCAELFQSLPPLGVLCFVLISCLLSYVVFILFVTNKTSNSMHNTFASEWVSEWEGSAFRLILRDIYLVPSFGLGAYKQLFISH
jgi:hypothetical protein